MRFAKWGNSTLEEWFVWGDSCPRKSYFPFNYENAPCFFSNAPYIFLKARHIHTNCEPHLKKCKAHFWIFHTELQQRSAKTGQWNYEYEL